MVQHALNYVNSIAVTSGKLRVDGSLQMLM